MSEAPAAPPAVSADQHRADGIDLLLRPPSRLLPARVAAMCAVELQKLRHDRTEPYTRAVQPALWLLIFGQTFARLGLLLLSGHDHRRHRPQGSRQSARPTRSATRSTPCAASSLLGRLAR